MPHQNQLLKVSISFHFTKARNVSDMERVKIKGMPHQNQLLKVSISLSFTFRSMPFKSSKPLKETGQHWSIYLKIKHGH